MKRLMAFLLVAVITLCLVACDKGDALRGMTQGSDSASGVSQTSSDSNITTTPHTHSEHTTTYIESDSQPTTDENGGDEGQTSHSDLAETTTVHGSQPTTSPSVIVTTTKKGETTTTQKTTTTTTTTTKKTTTTTTKKTTTTTTKKTTTTTTKSTTKTHTFGSATYSVVDINTHKVTGKCTSCGVTTSQTESHNWGSWIYDKYPTATAQGIKYRVCSGCTYEQVTYVPATSVNTSTFPQEMFALVNAERAKNGLPALTYYTGGQTGANTRAKELLVCFSHNRPDGTKWWTAPGFDRNVCQAGAENIAIGYGSPSDVVSALMGSPDNKKNILSTTYTHIVIAYYEGAWVQIFVKPW